MKKLFFILTLTAFVQTLSAQIVPLQFSYQAVLRDKSNQPMTNKNVSLRFFIFQGDSINGHTIFKEIQNTTTNDVGIVTLNIGSVTPINRNDFKKPPYFLEIDIDPEGGNIFEKASVAPLLSVPFAFVADSTLHQVIQTLSVRNDSIVLSNGGGGFKLPTPNIPPRTLDLIGRIITLTPDNSSVTVPSQKIGISNDTITLSDNGGFIKLPASTNTQRALSLEGRTLTLTPDNSSVTLPLQTTQVLALTNDTITLSNGGGFVKLPASTNIARSLAITGQTLTLLPDNSKVLLPINLPQILSLATDTIKLSNGGGFVKLPASTNTVRALSFNDTTRVLTINPDNSTVTIPNQTLSIKNDTLTLSKGGSVKLPSGNTPRTLSLEGRVLSLNPDNSFVTLPLQTTEVLAISNDTISLSNGGGFVKLPSQTNTPRALVLNGRVLTLNPDNSSVTLPLQTIEVLSISNDTLKLSNGGGFVKLPSTTVVSSNQSVLVTKTGNNYDLAVPTLTYSSPDTTVTISKTGNNISLSAKTILMSSNNSVSIVKKPTPASSNIFDLTVNPTVPTTLTSNNQTVTLTKTANNYDLAVNFANYLTTVTSADKSIIVTKTGNNYDLKSNVTAKLVLPYLDSTKSLSNAFSILSTNSSAIVGTTNYFSQAEGSPTKYGVLGIATTYAGIGVSGQNKSGTGLEGIGTYGINATGSSIGLSVSNSVNYSYVSLCTASNSGYFYGLPVYIANTDLTVDGTIQASFNKIILEGGGSGASAYGYFTVRNATPHELFTVTTVAGLSNNGYAFIRDQNGSAIRAGMYLNSNNQGIVFGDVKSFKMQHPKYPDKDIVYACVEGPEVAAYSRGTAQLVNGEAIIKFSEHFIEVINPETATFILTPRSIETYGLAVVESSATGFTVKELHPPLSPQIGGMKGGNFKFDWEVKAVRKGYEKFEPVQDKVLPSQPTVFDNTLKNKNELIKRN